MLRKHLCDLELLDEGTAWALGRQLAELDDD